jgi:V/A-type H+-transporting ATPase subunit K
MLGAMSVLGLTMTGLLFWTPQGWAQTPEALGDVLGANAVGWGLLAAALATGLSALGAAYAVGHVGAAAIGAIAEKPELFGRMMILVGLAEGIAIYGIIISILILNRLAP